MRRSKEEMQEIRESQGLEPLGPGHPLWDSACAALEGRPQPGQVEATSRDWIRADLRHDEGVEPILIDRSTRKTGIDPKTGRSVFRFVGFSLPKQGQNISSKGTLTTRYEGPYVLVLSIEVDRDLMGGEELSAIDEVTQTAELRPGGEDGPYDEICRAHGVLPADLHSPIPPP